ncbi:MAG TPA: NUDIX domain-containing protein [Puia sp.]|jgi:8-oxo-dGTP pyrophosphatase MutT (NUDIX family)|nr:NUDIX domain-containing protein [Puia sp.]
MYIKIYFDDKPLFLCDRLDKEIEGYVHHDDAVLIDEFSPPAVNSMIHEMRLKKIHAGIFLHNDLATLKKAFWKKFLIVQAGGGWVQNERSETLFIFRRGKWDLPKGKLDKGETLEQCAIREVGEETGLQKVRLEAPLLVTYHTYDENGKHILKETHWYRMAAAAGQLTKPQQEEQITELRWVGAAGMRELLQHTFPSIIDVVKAAGRS